VKIKFGFVVIVVMFMLALRP